MGVQARWRRSGGRGRGRRAGSHEEVRCQASPKMAAQGAEEAGPASGGELWRSQIAGMHACMHTTRNAGSTQAPPQSWGVRVLHVCLLVPFFSFVVVCRRPDFTLVGLQFFLSISSSTSSPWWSYSPLRLLYSTVSDGLCSCSCFLRGR